MGHHGNEIRPRLRIIIGGQADGAVVVSRLIVGHRILPDGRCVGAVREPSLRFLDAAQGLAVDLGAGPRQVMEHGQEGQAGLVLGEGEGIGHGAQIV